MKIKRFNEKFEYTTELKKRIEHYDWDKDKIRYHISLPSDNNPGNTASFINIEHAIEQLQRMNSDWDKPDINKTYCLFESRIRAVSEDEIDLALKTKKYNL